MFFLNFFLALLLGFVPFGSNLGIFGRLAGLFLLALFKRLPRTIRATSKLASYRTIMAPNRAAW